MPQLLHIQRALQGQKEKPVGIFLHLFFISQICGPACRRESYCVAAGLKTPPPMVRKVEDIGSRSLNTIMATSSRSGGRAGVEE